MDANCEQASATLICYIMMIEGVETPWLHFILGGKTVFTLNQACALPDAHRALSIGEKQEYSRFLTISPDLCKNQLILRDYYSDFYRNNCIIILRCVGLKYKSLLNGHFYEKVTLTSQSLK